MSILGEIPTTSKCRPFKIATWHGLKLKREKHTTPHMEKHYQPKRFLSLLVTKSKLAKYVLTTIHKTFRLIVFIHDSCWKLFKENTHNPKRLHASQNKSFDRKFLPNMTACAILKLKIQMKKQRWYNIKRFHLLRLHLYVFCLHIL